MTTNYGAVLFTSSASTIAEQGVDLLPADIRVTRDTSVVRISVAATAAVKLIFVPSSGTGFYLNAGGNLPINGVHTEDVVLDIGRTWNLQSDDVAGITTTHLVIQEVGP